MGNNIDIRVFPYYSHDIRKRFVSQHEDEISKPAGTLLAFPIQG